MQPLEFWSKQSIHKAHTKAIPEFTTFHKFYFTESNTKLLLQTEFKIINKVLQSSSAAENKWQSSDNTRHHDETHTWYSALSSLAGNVFHSTDQPGGRVHGQVKLVTMSSKVSHENKPQSRLSILILSKAYPTSGIYLADSKTCKAFGLKGLFWRKASKSESLLSNFSIKF
jgi:hypothetical protein